METIKRKILLEDSTDRTVNSPTWGQITATTFYLKVNIVQNMDDMGLFTDIDYIPSIGSSSLPPDYSVLIEKLSVSGFTFPFMTGATQPIMTGITGTNKHTLRIPSNDVSTYYKYDNSYVSGSTDSRLEDVRSYNILNPFRIGFNVSVETYENYQNISIDGVDRIKSMGEPRIYVFDTLNDSNLGTDSQVYGLKYLDYTGKTRTVVIDNIQSSIPLTNFSYIGEGWNETNTSLSALVKEEYLFGIISVPEVQSDVFIDRGQTSVLDMHLKLSEIKDLGGLSRYGNGLYKLNK